MVKFSLENNKICFFIAAVLVIAGILSAYFLFPAGMYTSSKAKLLVIKNSDYSGSFGFSREFPAFCEGSSSVISCLPQNTGSFKEERKSSLYKGRLFVRENINKVGVLNSGTNGFTQVAISVLVFRIYHLSPLEDDTLPA